MRPAPAVFLAESVAVGVALQIWVLRADEAGDRAAGRGAALYAEHCAACHGANLEGQPDWQRPGQSGRLPAPPHDASGHTWHHSDADFLVLVRDGIGAIWPDYQTDMPAFGGLLGDAEIVEILGFLKSRWPDRERAYQAARNADGTFAGGKQ